ncbi:MAG TPA: (deoxy)nucleoside triphosphate pyrophosphohydrolase [Myxococcota bacterium]|nr:(deoxy)nucleoside triphosphate pyrophosphohydrolase [Myxococcota bacterium]HNH48560.1 (deoxy)nucleoside triphosphate pyrophosphohydrolase [Myxococcota bacterium]
MRTVVGAAILRAGRVLAAQRGPGMSNSGVWEFPGGKLEPGETEPEALVRELREELSLRVRPLERLGLVQRPERRMQLAVWICELVEGEPVLLEHSAVEWVAADALHALGWAEPDLPFLPEVHRRLS